MALMAICGLLPCEGVEALLQTFDQPFEDLHTLLAPTNGQHGLFEPFAQVLLGLLRLFQCFIFAPQGFVQGILPGSQLFQFFVCRQMATLADCPSSRNCLALLNSSLFLYTIYRVIGCSSGKDEATSVEEREC